MFKLPKAITAAAMLMLTTSAVAEIKKTLGDWDVHYIAFNSTFLSPQVAKAYGIARSENNTLINISVLNRVTSKAQHVQMSGIARNLLGSTTELEFKEVVEGDAIYYLSTLTASDEEHFRFIIDIKQGKIEQQLKFEQKLYKE